MDLSHSLKIKCSLYKVTLLSCEQTCQLTQLHIDQTDLQAAKRTETFFFANTNAHHILQNFINEFIAETESTLVSLS